MSASPARLLLRELPSLAGPLPDFDPAAVADTPQDQFIIWLREAIAAGIAQPHAMTLATVDADGRPDARILILKDLDERGWHFATSRQSPKGQHLAAAPDVALTFYWPLLGRQVRIRGAAIDQGQGVAAADFRARSADARANAALERQSRVMDAETTPLPADTPEVPASWSVFAVRPGTVEFWQGRTDRQHIRLLYERVQSAWKTTRLWP